MMKNIVILGSTGSIGTQTLDVVRSLGLTVYALTAHSNVDLMEAQIREFSPKLAVMYDEAAAIELKKRIGGLCEINHGIDGIIDAATCRPSIVVNSLVGSIGLLPTIAAIKAGNTIALANKETLVCAGEIIMPLARKHNVDILPLDSEHSAIFQCLDDNKPKRLLLTASGGPFRGRSLEEMHNVTVEQALAHPNWSMGKKISIDSATMMNKGLEVIEARWLFDVPQDNIDVVIHPQSIVHSMVEFNDGQVIAQLGAPDMRLVIQYGLTYPTRLPNNFGRLDFSKQFSLDFSPPDMVNFSCLRLAYDVLRKGGLYPAILNAANEAAVDAFLDKKIGFTDIPMIIENALSAYTDECRLVDVDAILHAQNWAKTVIGGNK
ncbi:MAG: 1-deoxy-D-xylulose-5-phosphate reductoisomerase [Defluviitaleaceae bacterium]|nr:1-deoxy-D-xylulose-5-phosphate reductoisomerase [Defluviitaleaceae bacterium]